MRLLVETCEETLAGKRDKALLLIGFAGALRRSDLATLQVADISKTDGGLTILIKGVPASHQVATNRIDVGRHPATCPVRALENWLKAAVITEGPLFRKVVRGGHVQAHPLSAGGVWQIVKKRCQAAGLESGDFEYFSPQSLRAGFIESTYNAGVATGDIIAHSRHKRPPPIRGRINRTGANHCKFVSRLDL
nr:tyrosine-type recombinase/integrase [Caulobacter sp. 602-2]